MSLFTVTGGAGSISTTIVEELLRRRETVRIVGNFPAGRRESQAPFLEVIRLREGDVQSPNVLRSATSFFASTEAVTSTYSGSIRG